MVNRMCMTVIAIVVCVNALPVAQSKIPGQSYNTSNFFGAKLLSRPTDRSVTVNVIPWTALEIRIEYGTDTVYDNLTPAETTFAYTPLEIVLDGLIPNTRYYYRMRYLVLASGDSIIGPGRTFHTQRASGESFTFAVEADPHMLPGEDDTAAVFELTLQNIAASNPDFLIDLGDNIMLDDLPVATPAAILGRMCQYRRWWGEICHSIPLYLVLGNHEGEQGWNLNGTVNSRPVLFATGRKLYFPNPVPDGFYSGDSIPEQFVGLREDYYAWEWGNALFVVLDPFWHTMTKPCSGEDNWNWTLGRAQYDWLRRTLESSSAKFKFVFLHHLVGGKIEATARGGIEYSSYYEWGGLRTDHSWGFDAERPGWSVPIHQVLIDNHVDILFHGHDHFYAQQDTDAIVYQLVPPPARTQWESLATRAVQCGYQSGTLLGPRGYVRVTVDDTSTTVAYIRTFMDSETTGTRRNGMVSHTYTLVKRESAVSDLEQKPSSGLVSVAPSPFRKRAAIAYELPASGPLQLQVFDVAGRLVKTLFVGNQAPGDHQTVWDGSDNSGQLLPAGVYICLFKAGEAARSIRIVLLR